MLVKIWLHTGIISCIGSSSHVNIWVMDNISNSNIRKTLFSRFPWFLNIQSFLRTIPILLKRFQTLTNFAWNYRFYFSYIFTEYLPQFYDFHVALFIFCYFFSQWLKKKMLGKLWRGENAQLIMTGTGNTIQNC